MRGFDHPMARLLSANADFIGEARCRGRLYLVKHYPGLVLSDAPMTLYSATVPAAKPAEPLREFDMYEACGEGFAPPTEYIRQMLKVTLDGGAGAKPGPISTTGTPPPATDRLGRFLKDRRPQSLLLPASGARRSQPCE